MKRIIKSLLFCFLASVLCVTAYAENQDMKFIEYPCIYDQLSHFQGEYAVAKYSNEYCVIDRNNRIIYRTEYPTLRVGSNYFIYTDDTGCKVSDLYGNIICELDNKIGMDISTSNYIHILDAGTGMHGVASINGNEVVPFEYDSIEIQGKTCIASKNNVWYVIDLLNAEIKYTTSNVLSYLNDNAILMFDGERHGIVNTDGIVLCTPMYDEISYHDAYYRLTVHTEGEADNIIVDEKFDKIYSFSGSFVSCSSGYVVYIAEDNNYYIVTLDGDVMGKKHISNINELYAFSDGLAVEQSESDAYYFVNPSGVREQDNMYDFAYSFKNGYAVVCIDDYDADTLELHQQYYVIDRNYDKIYTIDKQLCYDKDSYGQITFADKYILTYDPGANKYGFIKLIANTNSISTYDIVYDVNGEKNIIAPIKNLPANSRVDLPECSYIKSGFAFSCWTDGTNNYNPGDTFVIPNHDVTMSAVWTKTVESFAFEIGDTTASVGETVSVPVTVTNNPGIASFGLSVNFLSDILKPVTIRWGDAFTGGSWAKNLENMYLTWVNSQNSNKDGLAFTIDFEVIGEPGDTGEITLVFDEGSPTNDAYETVEVKVDPGTFTVRQPGTTIEEAKRTNTANGVKLLVKIASDASAGEESLLIVAAYDGERLLQSQNRTIDLQSSSFELTLSNADEDDSVKVFLLDPDTYKPLAEALTVPAQ